MVRSLCHSDVRRLLGLETGSKLLAMLVAITVFAGLLISFASAAAKPTGADPDGIWGGDAANQDFGLVLTWENAAGGYTGVGLSAGVALNPPTVNPSAYDPYTQSATDTAATFTPFATGNYHAGVDGAFTTLVDNRRDDQTYQWDVKFRSGTDRPDSGALSWDLENSTHSFIPNGYLAVLKNESTFINLSESGSHRFREDDNLTLYVMPQEVVNSIFPDNQRGPPRANLEYTFAITNPVTESEDTYTVESKDNLGWPLSIDNEVTVPAGSSKHIKLTVSIPDNASYDVWDNIKITATSQSTDNTYEVTCRAKAVRPGVQVSIEPEHQDNLRGGTLRYPVTVKNTAAVSQDTYTLENVDNLSWSLSLEDNELTVPAGENEKTTLTVSVPDNAPYGVWDNIWVTATSQTYNTVDNIDNCRAKTVPPADPGVSITPPYDNNLPGNIFLLPPPLLVPPPLPDLPFAFTVEVTNPGSHQDTYTLENGDNLGWSLELGEYSLKNYWTGPVKGKGKLMWIWVWRENNEVTVPAGGSENVTLRVSVPDNTELYGVWDNIWVRAASQADNNYENSDNCGAHVVPPKAPEISISPSSDNEYPGRTVEFTATITNPSAGADTYALTANDEHGWKMSFDDNELTVPTGENRKTTLTVSIPDVTYGTCDSVTVTATSQTDNSFENSAGCEARVAEPALPQVSISPSENKGMPGWSLKYKMRVKNPGPHQDTYDLTVSSDWSSSISYSSLTLGSGDNETATLTVNIPDNTDNTFYGTYITPTVTATSQIDDSYENSVGCTASVVSDPGVEVDVSPNENPGSVGENLSFQVEVINTGGGTDNYTLLENDNLGWPLSLSENEVTVTHGSPENVTLTVTIPDSASLGALDNIQVTAISQTDNSLSDSTSCAANAAIKVSPQSQSVDMGGFLTYTVSFCNTGEEEALYELTATDDSGWLMWFEENTFSGVQPGETRTTTLTVMASSRANEIAITASNNTSASATVSAEGHAPIPPVEIILWGDNEAYNLQSTYEGEVCGPEPWVWYGPGNESKKGYSEYRPPIMAAAEIKKGAVVAGGTAAVRGGDVNQNFARLLDNAFQWMVSGAKDVLWYDGYECYNNSSRCATFIGYLEDLGYTVTGDDTEPITSDLLTPYDILVVNQLEPSTDQYSGGHPSLLPDADVRAIKEFVEGGGGLYITEQSDFAGHNYNKTQNKILKALSFSYLFQNDAVQDNNAEIAYIPPLKVNTSTWIGSAYENAVGKDNVEKYSVCSLAPAAANPEVTLAAPSGVFVETIPEENVGLPGESLSFTVAFASTRSTADNYVLTVEDDRGWPLTLDDNLFELGPNGGAKTKLTVTIPEGASSYEADSVSVTATSRTNENMKGSASCLARAASSNLDVGVSVSPTENIGASGENVEFNVTVKNQGTEVDSYHLTAEDMENWSLSLSENSVGPLVGGGEAEVTLKVSIPEDVGLFDNDEITVTATSQEDLGVSDSGSCTARAVIENWAASLSVTPSSQTGAPGENLTYTVNVTNEGLSADNYELRAEDDFGWSAINPDVISLLGGGSGTSTLTVEIPSDAEPGTSDNVQVLLFSYGSGPQGLTVSCMANVSVVGPGVSVTISPSENTGAPDNVLEYTVTVTNTGDIEDAYDLATSGGSGWSPNLSVSSTDSLSPGSSQEVTLSVTVPSDAEDGNSTSVTVTATSQADSSVSGDASCTATAEVEEGPEPFPIVPLVGAVVGIVVVVGVILVIRPF